MPFTPTVTSAPMPQSMIWFPTQQTSLVAPVTPHVVSTSQCFNPIATCNTFRQSTPSEELVTVFVGNISEKVPHIMIKHILATCGNIATWKSEQGFGFCEYYQSESALLAIKILHDMEVSGKKLVVKVDTKTQKKLDKFKEEKKGTDDSEKNQKFEIHCRQRINSMITDYNDEMIREGKQNQNKVSIVYGVTSDMVPNEDEKKKTIFQEKGKFRKNMKKKEKYKIERKKNQEKLKLNERYTTPGKPDSEENRMIRRREEQDKCDREKNERTDKEIEKSIDCKEKISEKRRGYFHKNKLQEKEMEELELKKDDDRQREKVLAYQEKLNQWLIREKQKKEELSKECVNKQIIEEERKKNAKQLKEFLEGYDDDNDDQKYFKGQHLQNRINLREKEIEEDERDRQREKDELVIIQEKINNKIILEFAEVLEVKEENMYKPKLLIDVAEKQKDELKQNEMEIENQKNMEVEQKCQKHVTEKTLPPSPQQPATSSSDHSQIPPPEFALISQPTQPITLTIKKKINIRDVFNNDDEESPRPKKRILNHLDKYNNEKKEKERKAVEEKKKSIRHLIERIPTDKDELFSFPLDWTVVDLQLIKKRIWPWVNKKIIEYIGEPEPTLADFICSKVESGSSPQAIIDDVQTVLDDEAELFIIKMWRLIVLEVEKKKLRLAELEKNGHEDPFHEQ